MIRYVLAGMATVAGLVLLFLGSFGNQPAPHGAGAVGGNPPAAMLQPQMGDSPETVESLRKQLAEARQDLASLQDRKTAAPTDAGSPAPAAPPHAAPTKAPAAAPTAAVSPAASPHTGSPGPQAPPPASTPAASTPAASTPATPSSASPAQAVTVARSGASPNAAPPPSVSPSRPDAATTARAAPAEAARPQQQASRSSEPTQPFGFGPRARTETRSDPASRSTREAMVVPPRDDPTAADGVIERLRREAMSSPAARAQAPAPVPAPIPLQVPPVQGAPPIQASSGAPAQGQTFQNQAAQGQTFPAQPAPEQAYRGQTYRGQAYQGQAFAGQSPSAPTSPAGPHRIPTGERLADARLAVQEGRIEDARRYLQAAQVQLVFQAPDQDEPPPRASLAAGPVGQALTALGYGDRGRALVAIDQAIGVLDGVARGASAAGQAPGQQADAGSAWPPLPVPRSWP